MTPDLLSLVAGIATGIALTHWHQRSLERAVNVERNRRRRDLDDLARQNADLRDQIEGLLRCQDSRDSYRQGMEDGVRKGRNMSQLEVLEGTLNRRNVQVGSR